MLVELDSRLVSAYLADGRTRIGGAVPPDGQTINVRGWRASKGTAAALVELDRRVTATGGAHLRLVEVYRSPQTSAEARAKYERWVDAGRPTTAREGLDLATMKTAFVRKPGESLHNAGMAVDIDQDALEFPGTGRGTDAALAAFWTLAEACGFTPIIAAPNVEQSESWHFDYFGVAAPILTLAYEAGHQQGNLIASMACTTLQGYQWFTAPMERYAQAALLLCGYWCGPVDGELGKLSQAAAKAAGATSTAAKKADAIINLLRAEHSLDQLVAEL